MIKQNYEKFVDKANLIHNYYYSYEKYIYVNAKTKAIIICPEHGEFEQCSYNHLNGKGCKLCAINKNKKLFTKTKDKFIEEANFIHNNKYNYSKSLYINDSTKLTIICNIHGEFEQTPNKHLRGNDCPKCKHTKIKQTFNLNYSLIFIDKAKILHQNKYEYLRENYIAMRKNMIMTCKIHGDFTQRPDNHLRGDGCPLCNNSIGENLIEIFLKNNNINYIREKRFNDCINKEKLPFDFYLEDLNTCIEFDGLQHFKSIEFFGGDKAFEIRKQNDKIKNEYCLKSNIRLIRISYKEIKNINNILTILI